MKKAIMHGIDAFVQVMSKHVVLLAFQYNKNAKQSAFIFPV